jgi:glycine hydroxymethyltransferase
MTKPDHTIENIPTLIDRTVFPGMQGGPHMHVIAAKAVSFYEALQPEFKTYAAQVIKNAKALADALTNHGFHLITGGTDNHLILVDVMKSVGIDGEEAQQRLEKEGITVNKNAIPFDTLPPFRPSGLRLGTPAITTRGAVEKDMQAIADKITQILKLS